MSTAEKQTGIQSAPATPPAPEATPLKKPQPIKQPLWYRAVRAIASLRLTVALFVLGLILVFFGTLAQTDAGIWTVVSKYFRCWFTWLPLQALVPFGQTFLGWSKGAKLPGAIPFPGGYTIGALMLVNLLAAHAVRFKLSWKRSGIIVLHAGLIVLLLSEIVTGELAVEAGMRIDEGGSANFVTEQRKCELAFVDSSDPKMDKVVVVPDRLLRRGGKIDHPDVPCIVEVEQFMVNSSLSRREAGGTEFRANSLPESSGVESRVDAPACIVTLRDRQTGQPIAEHYMTSLNYIPYFDPVEKKHLASALVAGEREVAAAPYTPVRIGETDYAVSLRFKRSYRPYTLYLKKFTFERYPGTEEPRNYQSDVRLVDPERGEDREVSIRMNEPLRYRGETFYQADFDHDTEKATVLQVVRNPGDWMPYVSCTMISLGMLLHFGITLVGFLRRTMA